ncbi:hypothetical protein A2368_01575 [Candidatus Collierbacteria bacterium RIFOXYB1_FULL_49_13]|uniref:Uncharacterized protein n=1 Tax=Candidatus Collierbacteria bacterium RIFOXYB1_FULL_49_13 TaxID=1817728 RepID=A0A1F5FFX1_9BACT|nr:MAG: hypothetical protein A2368_01575 [Candidatus Collierbacteria bacterium RIFOXYB1_FULL_49_13]
MRSDIGSEVNSFFFYKDLGSLVMQIVTAAIVIGAIGMILYFLVGGMNWLTAGGDKVKVETAQKTITQAIIGFVVIASAYAIFRLITQTFGLGDMSI